MDTAVHWVRSNALPLATVVAGNGFADLEPLRNIIGTARIVSLGEATHGTREFFQLKHRLLEYCVAELGFTIFAIEASYPECLRINDYVLNGTGNPAEALAGQRFWTWDTEEVLALIEWMRNWNGTHEGKVKFYGFDMQFPTEAALGVLDYLNLVAPKLAAASELPLWALSNDFSADRFHLLPQVTRDAALTCVELILASFDRERANWIKASSEVQWGLARMNAVVLEQSTRLRLEMFSTSSSMSRDVAMAQNVAALLELEGHEAKAVLWAHNGHARKCRYVMEDKTCVPTMGNHLCELFDREHVVIGFAFNEGTFQAIERERGLIDHTVAPAPKGSLDNELAAAGVSAFLLDLSSAPRTGPVADWLASEPVSRSIGSVYAAEDAEKYLEAVDPRRAYDILAFVETTTAARANEAGRRVRSPELAPAAVPTNLELASDSDIPSGWEWTPSRRVHAHRLERSRELSPLGRKTVCIARTFAPWRWGDGRLEQTFSAKAWRGKRIGFSGAARSEVEGPASGAQLYVETRPKAVEKAIWRMPATVLAMVEPPVQSPRWYAYSVEIDVPHDAETILIGLALAGDGAAWFGDLELTGY